jgi:hypothetical protein
MESIVNVVDGKLMVKSRTHLLASIITFCLFIEMISNEKKHRNNINEPMSHFGNNAFLESNEKKHGKCINEPMLHSTTTHFQNPMKRYNASLESISKNDIMFQKQHKCGTLFRISPFAFSFISFLLSSF